MSEPTGATQEAPFPMPVIHTGNLEEAFYERRRRILARTKFWQKVRAAFFTGLVLIAYGVGVIFISFHYLIHNSLRLDEAQSLWQTSHSFSGMLKVVAEDVHVPLYHVILHFWDLYFGEGITTIRLLSLLFFLITIPLFYILSRQMLSQKWSLFATLLFSFSPFMNWYANEARMYTLLALMATFSQLFFVRIIRYNKGWVGYGITALIGVYSHYFFLFTLAAQGIFYLLNRKQFAPGTFKKLVFVMGLAFTALLPWLYYFHSLGSGANTSPLLAKPSTVDFFNAFSQFAFGFQTNHINTIILSCWPLLILGAFFAVRKNLKIHPEIQYMFAAALIPVILAYIISLFVTPFFLSRYMVPVVAPLTILFIWFIAHYPKKLALTICVLALISTSFAFYREEASAATPVKEDYQAAASTIAQDAKPDDIVVLSAPFSVYPFQYYYHGSAQIATLPEWNRSIAGAIPAFNPKTLPSQVADLNQNHHYVYLLLSQDQGYESTIRTYYETHFKHISTTVYSPDLSLLVYQVGYTTVQPL